MNPQWPLPYREPGAPVVPAARPRLWTLLVGTLVTALLVGLGTVLTLGVFVLVFVLRSARAGGRTPSASAIAHLVHDLSLSAPGLLASGLVSSLSFGGVALLAGVLSADGALDRLRLRASPRWFATGLAAMAQLLGIGMLASQTAVLLGVSEEGTLPALRRAFSHLTPPLLALAVLIVGAGAGVSEELFFRGFLLTRLEQRVRPWLSNLAVAMLFALAHFDPVHSSFALLVGLAQGWTSRRSGSIRAAVVAHTFNNVIGVVGMAVAGSTAETFEPAELAGGAALLVAGTAGVWWLTRRAGARSPAG